MKTTMGRVTSNDGDVAIVTLASADSLKIHRPRTQNESLFQKDWPVGKDVAVEV